MHTDTSKIDIYLQTITRLAYLLYWLFDNLAVLTKIKLVSSLNYKTTTLRAYQFRLIGIIFALISAVKNTVLSHSEDTNRKQANQSNDLAPKVASSQTTNTIDIVKNLCDAIYVTQSLGYPKMILGIEFNEGVCGISGFTSAALQCYRTFPSK